MEREDLARCLANMVHAQLDGDELKEIPKSLNFQILMTIARRHQMTGIIGQSLLLSGILTPTQEKEVRMLCLRSWIKYATQQKELQLIQKALSKNKIKHLPLKGVYMRQYYSKPELREMGDLDICIFEKDMDKARKVLEENDFKFVESVSNHDIYVKPPYILLEVHKNLYKKEIDKRQHDYFGSLDRAIPDEENKYCFHQTIEDFYIYMISHMAGHFYKRGCGIRNLLDLYYFRKNYHDGMNEEYVKEALNHCGLTAFTEHMYKLAKIWLEGGNFTDFYGDLFDYMLDCGVYGRDEFGIWNEFANLNKHDVNRKIYMNVWYLFPPLHYMKRYYPCLARFPFLLPIIWMIRILRGMFFKSRKIRRDYLHSINEQDIDKMQRIYQKLKLDFES